MDPLNHQINQQALDLAKEILEDKKKQRRFQLLSKLIWAFIIVGIFYSIFSGISSIVTRASSMQGGSFDEEKPHISKVDLVGPMFEGSPASADIVIPALEQAFKAPMSKAVFIQANSPGGAPVQSATINDAIIRLKAQYKKPVYAIISDLCASACYYAIAHVDTIVASPVSLVGSIGVRLESYDLRGLAEKIGVKQRLLTAGEYKALLDPLSPLPEEVKAHLQKTIDATHQEFISVVKSGRNNKIAEDAEVFNGLIWGGNEALQLGLIDAFGDNYSIANQDFNGMPLVDYNPEAPWIERIMELSERTLALLTSNNNGWQLRSMH